MKLVIVESPKKCDTIGRYLGQDYKVMASQGHVRDLSTRGKGGLGIDVNDNFKPDFEINPDRSRIIHELEANARRADEVILATDPDREGEAISWHLAQILGLDVATTKRLQFHEITRPAILEALKNPGTIDMKLVESQETRRMCDRIIGFKLSSLLKNRMGSKSAGRVQSATLKMIVENDKEIAEFVPEEYWTIEVTIKDGNRKLKLALDRVDGKQVTIVNENHADALLSRLQGKLHLVDLSSSVKSIPSRLPLTTSTMQQEAYQRYHFSTHKTQSIAQRLYEGMDINGEHVGLITYIRTDSTRLSPDFYQKHAKPYILETYGPQYLGFVKEGKKIVNAQDAHEAIRPTGTHRTPDLVAKFVGADEAKLYRLIYERALASCMSDKKEEVTTAVFEANGLTFKVVGSRTLFLGHEILSKDPDKEVLKELPPLTKGADYPIVDTHKEQKFTKAPARYTEAKIVKLMEEEGIGRPSTYASTIQTLQKRGYISSKGGVVTPTESGIRTIQVLDKYFPKIVSAKYTAEMETKLDEIEEGKLDRLTAMNEFYGPFIEHFEKVSKKMYKDPDEPTGRFCPVCGAPLLNKRGRYGTFVACGNYPKCSYIEKKEPAPVEKVGRPCPVCGKDLIKRKDKKGRPFIACIGFPTCTYVESISKRTQPEEDTGNLRICPSCGKGHLKLKHGKKVDFYGCTNFPKCRYVEWISEKGKKKDEK